MPYPNFLYNTVCLALLLAAPLTVTLAVTPTPTPTPTPPPLPTPSPTPSAQRTVSFQWNASADSSVLGYKIYWGTGSGNYQNVLDVKNVLTTSLVLSSSTQYYVAVSAYNIMSESFLSNEVTVPGSTM